MLNVNACMCVCLRCCGFEKYLRMRMQTISLFCLNFVSVFTLFTLLIPKRYNRRNLSNDVVQYVDRSFILNLVISQSTIWFNAMQSTHRLNSPKLFIYLTFQFVVRKFLISVPVVTVRHIHCKCALLINRFLLFCLQGITANEFSC